MKIIQDRFANIDQGGVRIHSKVRVQQDDQDRVAVFLSPIVGPSVVYSLHDVVVTETSGGGCSHPVCRGKAPKQKLQRLWEASEAQAASV